MGMGLETLYYSFCRDIIQETLLRLGCEPGHYTQWVSYILDAEGNYTCKSVGQSAFDQVDFIL